jgi:hypothetical protein
MPGGVLRFGVSRRDIASIQTASRESNGAMSIPIPESGVMYFAREPSNPTTSKAAGRALKRMRSFFALSGLLTVLAGCSSPAGAGAAAGAATGAVVGGPIGAVAGAAGGAIIGAVVGRSEARKYPPPPGGKYPVATVTSRSGFVVSPYTGRLYDVRGVPSGALVHDIDANKLFRNP